MYERKNMYVFEHSDAMLCYVVRSSGGAFRMYECAVKRPTENNAPKIYTNNLAEE